MNEGGPNGIQSVYNKTIQNPTQWRLADAHTRGRGPNCNYMFCFL